MDRNDTHDGKNPLEGMSAEALGDAVRRITANPAFSQILSQFTGQSGGGSPPTITPEMMAKLPGMMAALAPAIQGAPAAEGKKDTGGEAEKRKRLLSALRPYLSENRREAVDSIVRMTELTEMLSALKPPASE